MGISVWGFKWGWGLYFCAGGLCGIFEVQELVHRTTAFLETPIGHQKAEGFMTSWVLIIGLGLTNSISVSGIESEQECQKLAERLVREWTLTAPKMQCFSYRAAYRF